MICGSGLSRDEMMVAYPRRVTNFGFFTVISLGLSNLSSCCCLKIMRYHISCTFFAVLNDENIAYISLFS